jgi:hypothetical protein
MRGQNAARRILLGGGRGDIRGIVMTVVVSLDPSETLRLFCCQQAQGEHWRSVDEEGAVDEVPTEIRMLRCRGDGADTVFDEGLETQMLMALLASS